MSTKSKVVWSEGMFLRPQHFQQQDRYFESYVEGRCKTLQTYFWGFETLEIDPQLLKLGKISVSRCHAVFPDGTPIAVPESNLAPDIIDIPENLANEVVYLGVPLRRAGAAEVQLDDSDQSLTRYKAVDSEVYDTVSGYADDETVQTGQLRLRLLLQNEDHSGYALLGLIRIKERKEDKTITLDERYMPPLLDAHISATTSGFLNELSGSLFQRGESLAGRLKDSGRNGSAEISDYLMLQLVNRIGPIAEHLKTLRQLHPLDLYFQLVQMAGELATFTSAEKRPPRFTPYNHDDLQSTFAPVIQSLRQGLSSVLEQSAISLELVERKYGIRVSPINDRSLIDGASFVLAVKANLPVEQLRSSFPSQVKIAPVERIRDLVNAQLPGIALQSLPVSPRQIPYHAGFAYFQLNKANEFWAELRQSGGFALHLGADFPGLEIEFWAIRD
ncbi:MAG: type VI secretion system baseplate subunit TssK [Oleiphilus sp.]